MKYFVNRMSVVMPQHRFSLRNPSFAFIILESAEDMKDAIFKLNSKFMGSNDIQAAQARNDAHTMMQKYTTHPPQAFASLETESSVDDMLKPIRENRRVYISRMRPENARPPAQFRADLIELLQPFELEALSKVNVTSGLSFLFADATTAEQADDIIAALNGNEALGGTLQVERVLIENPAHGWDRFMEVSKIPGYEAPKSSVHSETATSSAADIASPADAELSILPPDAESSTTTSETDDPPAPNTIETAMAEDTENPIPEEAELPQLHSKEEGLPTIPTGEEDPVPHESELAILPDTEGSPASQDKEVVTPKDEKAAWDA